MDDVLLNKRVTVERCLRRIHEEYAGDPARLDNITRQDAIVLNLQRACEAVIDAAMHVVAVRKLGLPKQTRDAFQLLENAGLLSADISVRMKKMVGFRNLAVHEYQSLDRTILEHIVQERIGDFLEFMTALSGLEPAE